MLHFREGYCSLHDLIQPSFSFLVGVALPFSLASRLARSQPMWRMTLHAAWRIVDLQSDLTDQVRQLEESPPVTEIVGEDHAGLRQTLRLCAATIAETLGFQGLPRHLRVALRTCRGLCLESLGEDDRPGDRPGQS